MQLREGELYEAKMLLKHKENELRTLGSTLDRAREDFSFKLEEALDKQHDRLIVDKQHEIQNINYRNEVLIK